MWFVEYTDNFHDWWLGLTEAQQDVITSKVELLLEDGPSLGRPSVDTIRGSRHPNMKELRAGQGGALRILFAFDPRRSAILLIGGNKSPVDPTSPNWNDWYDYFVPIGDDLYDEHINELRKEGLI